MKVLAQYGYGPGEKLIQGLDRGCITGVVFSPRYLSPDKMGERIGELRRSDRQLLFDPEFFATTYLRHPQPKLGSLEEWNYFRPARRASMISGAAIPGIIEQCLQAQQRLGLEEWIAPNVHVAAADSMDSAIALNFVGQTKRAANKAGKGRVYATLAFDRDVFLNGSGFRDIVDALTAIENPPDGYYVIVGGGNARDTGNVVRSDVYHAEVIAGWMYLNYALAINGAKVVNGYCHLLSPLLGICGAEGAASGWFSGLRQFSMSKYGKEETGGRAPVPRYVSIPLLSRIKHSDFLGYREIVPDIVSGTSSDRFFDEEPSRTVEALQSWEALQMLCRRLDGSDVSANLAQYRKRLRRASELWAALQEAGLVQELEANIERIEAMEEAINLFEKQAELA